MPFLDGFGTSSAHQVLLKLLLLVLAAGDPLLSRHAVFVFTTKNILHEFFHSLFPYVFLIGVEKNKNDPIDLKLLLLLYFFHH